MAQITAGLSYASWVIDAAMDSAAFDLTPGDTLTLTFAFKDATGAAQTLNVKDDWFGESESLEFEIYGRGGVGGKGTYNLSFGYTVTFINSGGCKTTFVSATGSIGATSGKGKGYNSFDLVKSGTCKITGMQLFMSVIPASMPTWKVQRIWFKLIADEIKV